MNIDKLLLSADQFTCDLRTRLLGLDKRGNAHQNFGAPPARLGRIGSRRRWMLPFAMDSTATGATVFDVRSRWPVVDETYAGTRKGRPNRWNARPGPHDAPRKRPIDGAWGLPFSLSLLPHCKLAAEYKQLPPKTYVPTSVHVRLREKAAKTIREAAGGSLS
jgi:hypothetical protein